MTSVTRCSVAGFATVACAAPGPSDAGADLRAAADEHGRREQHQEDQRRDEQRVGPVLVDLHERATAAQGALELLAGLRRDRHRRDTGQRQQQHPDAELLAPQRPRHDEQRPDRGQRQQHHDRVHDQGVGRYPADGEHALLKRESGVVGGPVRDAAGSPVAWPVGRRGFG